MTVSDIIHLALLPFPYIAFFSTVLGAIMFWKYQGSINEISHRILDSREHMDKIVKHVMDSVIIADEGDVCFLKCKNV